MRYEPSSSGSVHAGKPFNELPECMLLWIRDVYALNPGKQHYGAAVTRYLRGLRRLVYNRYNDFQVPFKRERNELFGKKLLSCSKEDVRWISTRNYCYMYPVFKEAVEAKLESFKHRDVYVHVGALLSDSELQGFDAGDYEQDDWLVSDSEPIELATEDSDHANDDLDVGEPDREASASRDVGNDAAEDEDTGEPVVEEGSSGDDELSDASEYKLQRLRRGRAVPPGKARSPSFDSNADSEPERDHAPQTPRRPKRVASRLTIMTSDTSDDDDDGVLQRPARRSSRSFAAEHAHLASPFDDGFGASGPSTPKRLHRRIENNSDEANSDTDDNLPLGPPPRATIAKRLSMKTHGTASPSKAPIANDANSDVQSDTDAHLQPQTPRRSTRAHGRGEPSSKRPQRTPKKRLIVSSSDEDEDDMPRTPKKRRTSIRPSSLPQACIDDKAIPATPVKVQAEHLVISSEEGDDDIPLSVYAARQARAREESLITPAKSKTPAADRSRPSAAILAGSPSRKVKSRVSTSIRVATPSLAAIDMNAFEPERPGEDPF
ncbi:hypothetical protein EV715DRAFT_286658 [Schizophyllum commune]